MEPARGAVFQIVAYPFCDRPIATVVRHDCRRERDTSATCVVGGDACALVIRVAGDSAVGNTHYAIIVVEAATIARRIATDGAVGNSDVTIVVEKTAANTRRVAADGAVADVYSTR